MSILLVVLSVSRLEAWAESLAFKPATAMVAAMLRCGEYFILQQASQPARAESSPRLFKISTLLNWSFQLSYILFELAIVTAVQRDSPSFLWQIWVLILAEICLTAQEAIFAFNLVSSLICADDLTPRPLFQLDGVNVPTVDVLIPCCGEPVDVILDTADAAAGQDYPSSSFRVVVLDDGHSDELRAAVKDLDRSSRDRDGPEILHLSRKVKEGEKSYFKAGNLHYGIEETLSYPICPGDQTIGSEFLASLDADMIPGPLWLRRMIPHLLLDPKAAMISPPQYYYNVPPGDPFGNAAEFTLWFEIYEPLNDHLGAAICNGSGFVFRRQAVESIGGWPLVDAGEDFMCSSLLRHAGWKVIYVREDLQRGLAPGSLRAHVRQRVRWADSGIEVHKRFGFYLPCNELSRGMSIGQRVVATTMMLREYAPLAIVSVLILFPLALYPRANDNSVMISDRSEVYWLQWLFVLAWTARKINNAIVYADVGVRGVANFQSNEIWCAPYTAARCFYSLLPRSLGSMTFEASGSILSTLNERSRAHRATLARRILNADMILHLAYILYALLPLILRLSETAHGSSFPLPGVMIKVMDATWKATVPLRYMLRPPSVPERRELMAWDEKGVWRPIQDGQGSSGSAGRQWWAWIDIWEIVVISMCLRTT